MTDLISRADAIDAVHEYFKGRMRKNKCDYDEELQVYVVGKEERTMLTYNKGINDKLRSLPSADATKKKAELKDNGDWDCPDVYCDECDHHRSVEWCSLAIPNHEEIDDTYKMVTEAFFEGFDAAEKRYRFLIETVEELDKKLADAVSVVRCKDCRHSRVYQTDSKGTMQTNCVAFVMSRTVTDDDFCSWGERREP